MLLVFRNMLLKNNQVPVDTKEARIMKKQVVGVGIILMMILLGASGCTDQKSSNNNSNTNQTDNDNTNPSTETIQTILGKAETIQSMYYEIIGSTNMTGIGEQTTMIKIWQKPPYLKEEITSVTAGIPTNLSVIQRPEGTYTYNTQQQKYILTTTNVTNLQQSNKDIIKDLLNNQTITTLGTDTIDGKSATIIQYTPVQQGTPMTIKMWIWNEKGLPLKAQFSMTMLNTTLSMEYIYHNYSFAVIPDSTFSVT